MILAEAGSPKSDEFELSSTSTRTRSKLFNCHQQSRRCLLSALGHFRVRFLLWAAFVSAFCFYFASCSFCFWLLLCTLSYLGRFCVRFPLWVVPVSAFCFGSLLCPFSALGRSCAHFLLWAASISVFCFGSLLCRTSASGRLCGRFLLWAASMFVSASDQFFLRPGASESGFCFGSFLWPFFALGRCCVRFLLCRSCVRFLLSALGRFCFRCLLRTVRFCFGLSTGCWVHRRGWGLIDRVMGFATVLRGLLTGSGGICQCQGFIDGLDRQ